MLKDKYSFVFTYQEANSLKYEIERMILNNGNTTDLELQLFILVIIDFQKRLISNLFSPKNKIKIHLKKSEALAFQILYLKNHLQTTFETKQIAHKIDITL